MLIDTNIVSPDNSLLDVSVDVGPDDAAYNFNRSTSFYDEYSVPQTKILSPLATRNTDYTKRSL
jgi:hypothetical protein